MRMDASSSDAQGPVMASNLPNAGMVGQ